MRSSWTPYKISSGDTKMYNAVGIDVSKGKNTIAVLQPAGVIVRKPFNVYHTSNELNELAKYIGTLEGETCVVLECTGVTMNQW